jgi:hypothetical protein
MLLFNILLLILTAGKVLASATLALFIRAMKHTLLHCCHFEYSFIFHKSSLKILSLLESVKRQ